MFLHMFGYGQEILLILILAFFVFGPSEFPKVARAIMKALGELRRMGDEVRSTVESNLNLTGLDGGHTPDDRVRVSPSTPSGASEIRDTPAEPRVDPALLSGTEGTGSGLIPGVAVTEVPTAAHWAQRGSRLFHRSGCIWGARIAARDRLYFETREQARERGGMSCPVCDA